MTWHAQAPQPGTHSSSRCSAHPNFCISCHVCLCVCVAPPSARPLLLLVCSLSKAFTGHSSAYSLFQFCMGETFAGPLPSPLSFCRINLLIPLMPAETSTFSHYHSWTFYYFKPSPHLSELNPATSQQKKAWCLSNFHYKGAKNAHGFSFLSLHFLHTAPVFTCDYEIGISSCLASHLPCTL